MHALAYAHIFILVCMFIPQSSRSIYDYQVKIGDMLGSKYRVVESLGKGSFGQVVSAVDNVTGAKVAVKVIKNKEAFRCAMACCRPSSCSLCY